MESKVSSLIKYPLRVSVRLTGLSGSCSLKVNVKDGAIFVYPAYNSVLWEMGSDEDVSL